jgi:hypothetical protein
MFAFIQYEDRHSFPSNEFPYGTCDANLAIRLPSGMSVTGSCGFAATHTFGGTVWAGLQVRDDLFSLGHATVNRYIAFFYFLLIAMSVLFFVLTALSPFFELSSRRRDHSRRPLTPPYIRFRIRRFMVGSEAEKLYQARIPDPTCRRPSSARLRSCAKRHCSTTARDRWWHSSTPALQLTLTSSDSSPG